MKDRLAEVITDNSPARLLGLAVVLMATVVVLGVMAVGGWTYLHLDALDDYRDGFALGEQWNTDGVQGVCNDAMEAIYGQTHERENWGAFLSGCTDGLNGRESASWYNLRNHLFIE